MSSKSGRRWPYRGEFRHPGTITQGFSNDYFSVYQFCDTRATHGQVVPREMGGGDASILRILLKWSMWVVS